MTQIKNITCFESSKAIVSHSSLKGNIEASRAAQTQQNPVPKAPSAAHIEQIRKASFLQYDFSPLGVVSVVLPDGSALAFNTDDMSHDVAETLIVACLHDKTVVGYDLYTSYTLSYCLSEEWQPRCTLNIPTLQRAFRFPNPRIEGLQALPQLMSMTGTKSFDAAIGRIFDWDESCADSFFHVCELMPYAMAQICAEAIHNMVFQGSNCVTFEAALETDFVKRRVSLMTPTKINLIEIDLYDFAPGSARKDDRGAREVRGFRSDQGRRLGLIASGDVL